MSEAFDQLLEAFRKVRREDGDGIAAARRLIAQAEAEDSARMAAAKACMGQALRDRGQAEAAAAHYRDAAKCYASNEDAAGQAHALRHEGDCWMEADRPDAAEAAYREAMRLYGGMDVAPLTLANAERSFALFYERQGEAKAAESAWRNALDGYRQAQIAPGVAECEAALNRLSGGAGA